MFYEIPIISSSNNPKKFQVLAPVGVGRSNRDDLITEINPGVSKTYQLGIDLLPDGLEDIREFLNPQPSVVFAWLGLGAQANYFGIDDLAR